jgi:hypothetical protein
MTIPVAVPRNTRSELVARVIAILTKPDAEWQVIDQEPATIASLFTAYIVPLAAIPPLSWFLGTTIFGYSLFGVVLYRPSFLSALSMALRQYVLALVSVFIMALIIETLAPSFQGQKNRVQALKLVAYSATASWVAGIFALLTGFGIIVWLIGFYSLYLFYKGLPVLMKTPKERTLPYTAAALVAGLVMNLVMWWIVVGLISTNLPFGAGPASLGPGGAVSLPGGVELNLDRLQKVTTSMEEAAEHGQSGRNPAGIPTETLKQFLPASLSGGLAQHDVSSIGGQVAGLGGSNVEARYGSGGKTVTLSVTDLGAAGAIMSLGGALGIKATQQNGSSYNRIDQVDGRTIAESYNAQTKSGDYSVVLANRFSVQAQGSSVTMDELRAAVNAVDLRKLETMAK